MKMLKHNNKIIASKIVYCDNLFRKGTGLMFHTKNAVDDTAWIFRFNNLRRVGVTMFFVFFPIDIVFLDRNNVIVELKECLKPFRNYTSMTRIYSFIELRHGTIKKYALKKGHVLTF
jgi:uncharacterized protein